MSWCPTLRVEKKSKDSTEKTDLHRFRAQEPRQRSERVATATLLMRSRIASTVAASRVTPTCACDGLGLDAS